MGVEMSDRRPLPDRSQLHVYTLLLLPYSFTFYFYFFTSVFENMFSAAHHVLNQPKVKSKNKIYFRFYSHESAFSLRDSNQRISFLK